MQPSFSASLNVLCLTGALFLTGAAQAEPTFSDAAAMPSPRQEIYATTFDGMILTAGGLAEQASAVRDDFLAYDPAADRWSELAKLPAARHHITLSEADGVIYAVGGFSGAFPDWKPEASVWAYDFDTNAWQALADLPVARGEHVSAIVDGRLYVIGGRVGGTPSAASFGEHRDTSRVDIFDLETGTWSRGIDAPTARNSAGSAVIDGKIYVVGGRQFLAQADGSPANVNSAALEVFDPETGFWSVRAPLPQGAGGIAVTAVDGKLAVFGGEQWTPTQEVFGEGWLYDPATDAWEALADLNVPRHGAAAAAIDGRVFVFGGATETGAGDVANNEALVLER